MNRRASLPGVDELFGARTPAPGRRPDTGAEGRREDTRPSPEEEAVARALGVMRQVGAGEDAGIEAARAAAPDLALPGPEVGALLRWTVTDHQARAVVEVGAAGGVTGLWMLPSMPHGGVLTSLEPDPDAHRLASTALEATSAESRVRSIQGEVATLLERLTDGGYDLVVLQAEHGAYPERLQRARTLLHSGGVLVARGVLPAGEHEEALLRFLHDLVEDPGFSTVLLPIDDGIAVATRLPDPA